MATGGRKETGDKGHNTHQDRQLEFTPPGETAAQRITRAVCRRLAKKNNGFLLVRAHGQRTACWVYDDVFPSSIILGLVILCYLETL
jgi:hypothetical protein